MFLQIFLAQDLFLCRVSGRNAMTTKHEIYKTTIKFLELWEKSLVLT